MSDAFGARRLVIDGFEISDDSDCYVIAEIGHNHQGNIETAKKLVEEAKAAGANAVKFQKRDNVTLYTRAMYERPYENENSFGPTYGAHREALEFGHAEYIELQAFAGEIGITLFATAFDHPSVDFLAGLDMPAYKIASGDLRNLPLLRHVAQTGRPVIISTGCALVDDVRRAHATIAELNPHVAVLHCTAAYPAPFDQLDLRVIDSFRHAFPSTVIGYSGHDNGIAMAVAAYVLGARVVEKHFTLNRTMKGTDHPISLEPVGLRKLVRDLRRCRVALGDGTKKIYEAEAAALQKMGKKLVASRALPAGHVLTLEDIAMKSPGDGLDPSFLERLLNRPLVEAVDVDDTLTLNLVGEPAHDRLLSA